MEFLEEHTLFVDGNFITDDIDEILDLIDNEDVAVVKKSHLDLVQSIEKLSLKLSQKKEKKANKKVNRFYRETPTSSPYVYL